MEKPELSEESEVVPDQEQPVAEEESIEDCTDEVPVNLEPSLPTQEDVFKFPLVPKQQKKTTPSGKHLFKTHNRDGELVMMKSTNTESNLPETTSDASQPGPSKKRRLVVNARLLRLLARSSRLLGKKINPKLLVAIREKIKSQQAIKAQTQNKPIQKAVKEHVPLSDSARRMKALVSADIENCMRPWLMHKLKLQPKVVQLSVTVQVECLDPSTIFGINLHKYANNMIEMIRVVELAIESNLIPPADAAPPIPKLVKKIPKHKTNSLNFMPKEMTPFVLGIGSHVLELSTLAVEEFLRQSVAAIVALLGFETAHQNVFLVLVDLLRQFLENIAYHFKLACMDNKRGWSTDFPNIAEKVLVDLRMSGCKGLHTYFRDRVVRYINSLEEHCEALSKHYKDLIASTVTSMEDVNNYSELNLKVEAEEEVVDSTQVQIAINEEHEISSLEAGFQLLDSLEAST